MHPIYNSKKIKILSFKTSKEELIDMLKGILAISFAFSILILQGVKTPLFKFSIYFIISFSTVGLGFLIHEIAHKVTAQRYGLISEFRANNTRH